MVPLSEQRSRVLILVNSCVHILYGVAALVLASLAVGLISDETHAADNGIQRNWETNMIIDIQSSKAESCPLGYEPMFSYNWPGTMNACNCKLWDEDAQKHGNDGEYLRNDTTESDFSKWNSQDTQNTINAKGKPTKEDIIEQLKKFGQENKVYNGRLCNWNQTQAGCMDVSSIPPMRFSKWKQKQQWCVARAQSVNMLTMYKYYDAEKGECTDDSLRVCGNLNNSDYQFCFPKSSPFCPINGILVTSHSPRGEEAMHFNSRPINIGKNKQLYFSRTLPESLPVLEFAVSEGLPCLEGKTYVEEEVKDPESEKKNNGQEPPKGDEGKPASEPPSEPSKPEAGEPASEPVKPEAGEPAKPEAGEPASEPSKPEESEPVSEPAKPEEEGGESSKGESNKKHKEIYSRHFHQNLDHNNINTDPNQVEDVKDNRKDYPLLNSKRQRCTDTNLDKRFNLLDSQGEQSFYFNNNQLYLRDVLPDFALNNTYSYNLYSKNTILWKHNCSEHIEDYLFSDTIFENFNSRESTLKLMTWLTMSVTMLLAITEVLLVLRIPAILAIESVLLNWSPGVQIGVQLILLPFNAAALHQAISISNLEADILEKQCTDPFSLEVLAASTSEIHTNIGNYNKGQIVLVCAVLLLNIVILLLNMCCSKSQSGGKKKRRASTY